MTPCLCITCVWRISSRYFSDQPKSPAAVGFAANFPPCLVLRRQLKGKSALFLDMIITMNLRQLKVKSLFILDLIMTMTLRQIPAGALPPALQLRERWRVHSVRVGEGAAAAAAGVPGGGGQGGAQLAGAGGQATAAQGGGQVGY